MAASRIEGWTAKEDQELRRLVARHGTEWKVVARNLQGRSPSGCRQRYFKIIAPDDEHTAEANASREEQSSRTQEHSKTSRPASGDEGSSKKSTSPQLPPLQLLPLDSKYDFDSDEAEKIAIETRWSGLYEAIAHSEFSASPVGRALHKRTQAVAWRFGELETSQGRMALMLELEDIQNIMTELERRFDIKTDFSQISGASQPPITEPEEDGFTRPRKAPRPRPLKVSDLEKVFKPKKVSRSRRMWDGMTQIVRDTSWGNRNQRRNSGDSVYPKVAYLYDPVTPRGEGPARRSPIENADWGGKDATNPSDDYVIPSPTFTPFSADDVRRANLQFQKTAASTHRQYSQHARSSPTYDTRRQSVDSDRFSDPFEYDILMQVDELGHTPDTSRIPSSSSKRKIRQVPVRPERPIERVENDDKPPSKSLSSPVAAKYLSKAQEVKLPAKTAAFPVLVQVGQRKHRNESFTSQPLTIESLGADNTQYGSESQFAGSIESFNQTVDAYNSQQDEIDERTRRKEGDDGEEFSSIQYEVQDLRRQESDLSLHASDHNQASPTRSLLQGHESDNEDTAVWPMTAPTCSQYDDSDRESIVSQVDSIFSVASLASTASAFSAASGYSAAQIESATRELLRVFLENEVLNGLYKIAILRMDVGPERLQRNIRRLLKLYARNLQSEAVQDLEKLAARLVQLKSAYVAHSIIQQFEVRSSVAAEAAPQPIAAGHQSQIDSSDEEDEVDEEEVTPDDAIDEDLIKDLIAFRKFLVEGAAFGIFQKQLEAFIYPKAVTSNRNTDQDEVALLQESTSDLMSTNEPGVEPQDCSSLLTKSLKACMSVVVAFGCLEPPLELGWVRLRWICKCGDRFFGDVKEYKAGGIQELVRNMSRSTGSRVIATPYSKTSANQKWTFKAPAWARTLLNGSSTGPSRASNSTGCLPQHNAQSQTAPTLGATPTAGSVSTVAPSTLHLLACAHRTQMRKCLLQDSISNVLTDQALFVFMKQQLQRNRSRIRSFLSMRSVRGMFFVKFRLRMGNIVEVRDHNPCCTSTTPNTCECIPPATKVEPSPNAEYRCTPAGPLATWPPVLSQDLMHMLSSPQCINEQETWVLEQLPKRTAGELLERIGQPAEGWGVYYQEGVDFDTIITVVFVAFLLASLLFAVLWTKFEMDIQGAFGVSSYMITAGGIVLAMVASRAKNFE